MRTSSTRRRFATLLSSLALSLPLLSGCSDQTVRPAVNLVDRTTKALSVGAFLEINGLYGAGCTNRSGAWSVGIDGFTALTNPALSVLVGDSGCILSIASVRLGALGESSLYVAAEPFPLWAGYGQLSRAFSLNAGAEVAFYANLRIEPDLTFSSNFTIDMAYSQDPRRVTGSIIASYYIEPVVGVAASAGAVSPPDYAIDMTGLDVQVDGQKNVRSATGSAALIAAAVQGQTYVVTTADLGPAPSFAAVDGAFAGGAQQSLGVLGQSILIPASAFGLDGVSLSSPVIRTLIVANEQAGIRSYEVFALTISAP